MDFHKVTWYLWQLERCVPNLPGLWDLDRLGWGPIHLQWIHTICATCLSGSTASKKLDQLGDVLVPWKANLKPTFSFYKVNELIFNKEKKCIPWHVVWGSQLLACVPPPSIMLLFHIEQSQADISISHSDPLQVQEQGSIFRRVVSEIETSKLCCKCKERRRNSSHNMNVGFKLQRSMPIF